jgi:hypothetical protein
MLGVVALLSGIAYLFTPLTAAGPEGAPTAFEVNIRYASPALALGALLLAIDPALTRERTQNGLLAALSALLLVGLVSGADDVWDADFLIGGVLLAAAVIAVPVALALAAQRGTSPAVLAAGAALAVGIAIGIGWTKNEDYLDDRYQAATVPDDFPGGITAALAWFNEEEPTDSRIAVVGGRPGFKQYVFYGDDLSNHVQYVARHGTYGAFTPIATDPTQVADVGACEEWLQALNQGEYDYLIAGPDQRSLETSPVEATWTGSDPAATKLVESDMTFVFRLDGKLEPAACRALEKVGGGESPAGPPDGPAPGVSPG